jgi:cell wall-associated NlpC family hydrolase
VSALELAHAAEALVGTRFRLHGRDRASGLDCIGVFSAAMEAIGRPVPLPNGYALRTRDPALLLPSPERLGFGEATGPLGPGDVALFSVGPAQIHLGIAASDGGIIHAHAGLRRVVKGPLGADWQIAGHWRLAPPKD